MRLSDNYIVHDAGGKQVMVDVSGSFSGLVRNNKTAAFIVECLIEDTTIEKIVDAMSEKYDAPKETIRKDVNSVIEKLKGIGAIIDQDEGGHSTI